MNSKIIGSILIVAGTAIGGGMLAMPIISAGVGFGGIALLMILIWIAMCYTAILLVETYKYNNPEDGLNTITYKYLGKIGSFITGLSILTLMYALVSAYIAGGSDIFRMNLNTWLGTDLSPQVTAILFTIVFGGIVGFGARIVDVCTKWIFGIKLLFLFLVITTMLPYVKMDNLIQMPMERALFFSAIPVIFTSFGFHIVVPSLVRYLEGNTRHLKISFIAGSLLPLLVYLVWQLSILGSIEPTHFFTILQENSGLEGMLKAVQGVSDSKFIQIPINVFTIAAILTSFLGVALALYDYILDLSKKKKVLGKPFSVFLITFIPPLLFALYYPKGFIIALGYAAISVVITSLFIPVFMFVKAKKTQGEQISIGHKVSFVGVFLLGILILIIQLLITLGKLPNIG